MAWRITKDLEAFDAAAKTFLAADPVRNSVLLTVPAILRRRGFDAYSATQPRFGWHATPDGQVTAAFIHTPPHPVVITAMSAEQATTLAAALDDVLGITGPATAAQAFALARGGAASVHRNQRLYRLAQLNELSPAPRGSARLAVEADRALLIGWYDAFAVDIDETPSSRSGRIIDDRISYGGLTIWEVDGMPVSMAGAGKPEAGTVRVGPVYTPKDLRGRGYGGAVTAAVTRQAIDAGAKEVVLFTDVDNPTSNALYQRIGYAEVDDYLVIHLAAADSSD